MTNLKRLRQNQPQEKLPKLTPLPPLVSHRLRSRELLRINGGRWWVAYFLTFPAIFHATATLIDNHEKKRKQGTAGGGHARGRKAAALDAFGAACGAWGLMAFGVVVWKLVVLVPLWATLLLAVVVWLVVSVGAWRIWKAL